MIICKRSTLHVALMPLAILGCALIVSGCASSVDVMPMVKSVKVDRGLVKMQVYRSSTPPTLDGQTIAGGSEFLMQPGQVLSVAADDQACTYRLVKASGDTAEFQQSSATRQPNGHWQHDTFNVRVKKFAGLSSDAPAQPPQ